MLRPFPKDNRGLFPLTCMLAGRRSDLDKTAKGILPFLAFACGFSLALRLCHLS
jgi:hypothetical protein